MTPGDSAGTPWAGRTLTDSPFAGDDGTAAAPVAALLDRAAQAGEPVDVEALVALLPGERLFVPVTAVSTGTDTSRGGDLGADMAIPTLRSPDGRAALPVFSCVAALAVWSRTARPVPVEARRAAVSAVQEGQQLLVLDPGAASVVVPRPAVWALAQGEPWTPSPRDPAVAEALRGLAEGIGGVVEVTGEPGVGAELRVVVHLAAGDGGRARTAGEAVASRLAADALLAERVDSVEVVTHELARPVIRVRPHPDGVVRRWCVVTQGRTTDGGERATRFVRTRAAALRRAERWCLEDGGHEWRPAAGGPTAGPAGTTDAVQTCGWCQQQRPPR